MSEEKKIKLIRDFEKFRDDVTSSKTKAIKFLERVGICTSTGELTEDYKQK